MIDNIFDHIIEKNYIQCYWQKYKPTQYINQIQKYFKVFIEKKNSIEMLISESNRWFISSSIFSSNNIENTGLANNETKELLSKFLQNPNGYKELITAINNESNTNRKEVLQHLHAYMYLCEEELHSNLTRQIILNVHAILMKDMKREDGQDTLPGEYRYSRITVGRGEQNCAEPEEIEDKMNALFKWFNESINAGNIDPFYLAADLKYRFIKIHPFVDGNGRVSRLLMNWVLLRFGLPFPIVLQAGFSYRAKKNYFGCYEAANPERALASLIVESVQTQFCSFFERIAYIGNDNLSIDDMLHIPDYQDLCEWKMEYGYRIDEMIGFVNSQRNEIHSPIVKTKIERISLDQAAKVAMHTKSTLPLDEAAKARMKIRKIIQGNETESSPVIFSHDRGRSYEEMESIARAFRFLCIDNVKSELTAELILKVYEILYRGQQSYRDNDAYIGSHLFPPASCISSGLQRIIDQYIHKKSQIGSATITYDTIQLSTWLMYQILALHPFKDGNGRMSRLLLNWSLLSNGEYFPVSFGVEKGATKGHRTLIVCIQMARSNLSKPSMLATRVLLSLYNSYKSIKE